MQFKANLGVKFDIKIRKKKITTASADFTCSEDYEEELKSFN